MKFRFRMVPRNRLKKAKTKSSHEVLKRLREYLDGHLDEPIRILCGFWKSQQNAISYQELRQAVEDGTIDVNTLKLWRQDYSILVANQLAPMWTDALYAGSNGQPILDGRPFELNMQKLSIINWIRERGAEFVTNSTQEQKKAISALLAKKMRDNHTVDELARMIRPCIGLTEGQATANAKYYDKVVETLTKDHPRMSKKSIQKKALDASSKYAERQHRQRAMTIAQTESAFAYNRGADEGIRQAQEEGLMGVCEKRWSTSGDERVCQTCASLDGTQIGMNESFGFRGRMLFDGHKMLPPAHPRCACAVEYIEVEPPKFTDSSLPEHENSDNINLIDEEQLALNKYFSSESYSLNEKLREEETLSEDELKWVEHLDAALNKMPEYKGLVYRSLSSFGIEDVDSYISSHRVGFTKNFPSYLSASEYVYDKTFPIQYIILSKHGKDVRLYNQGEREILFVRDSSFWITKIEGNTIYMEEV